MKYYIISTLLYAFAVLGLIGLCTDANVLGAFMAVIGFFTLMGIVILVFGDGLPDGAELFWHAYAVCLVAMLSYFFVSNWLWFAESVIISSLVLYVLYAALREAKARFPLRYLAVAVCNGALILFGLTIQFPK